MRSAGIVALAVGLAVGAVALGASAQHRVPGVLRLRADEPFDRASAVWVAPDGTRTPLCSDATSTEVDTCSIPSWRAGAGSYRLEVDVGPDGGRVSRSIVVRIGGEEIAVDVHVRRHGAIFSLLYPGGSDALRLQRAPARMRSATCRYVIRNASEAPESVRGTEDGLVAAFIEDPTRGDDDWLSHVHYGRSVELAPGEQRCLRILPEHHEGAAPLRRLAVYTAGGFVADTAGYEFAMHGSHRVGPR